MLLRKHSSTRNASHLANYASTGITTMANKPNKRTNTALASTANASSSATPTTSLLSSLRARSHNFMAQIRLNGFDLIPFHTPNSQSIDYLLIASTSVTPVFEINRIAVTIHADPVTAPLNRVQHGITKLDRYIVRISMTAQNFNTVTANLHALKSLWCTHPEAMATIMDSNKLQDPEHPNNNQEVPFEIFGIRTPNEMLFSKSIAARTETLADNPLVPYLPDPTSQYVQQLKKPHHFFLKPVIPLLNQETGDVLDPSSILDKKVTVYFQLIQYAFRGKIMLSPEIVAVTADPTAPEPPCKVARKSLFI